MEEGQAPGAPDAQRRVDRLFADAIAQQVGEQRALTAALGRVEEAMDALRGGVADLAGQVADGGGAIRRVDALQEWLDRQLAERDDSGRRDANALADWLEGLRGTLHERFGRLEEQRDHVLTAAAETLDQQVQRLDALRDAVAGDSAAASQHAQRLLGEAAAGQQDTVGRLAELTARLEDAQQRGAADAEAAGASFLGAVQSARTDQAIDAEQVRAAAADVRSAADRSEAASVEAAARSMAVVEEMRGAVNGLLEQVRDAAAADAEVTRGVLQAAADRVTQGFDAAAFEDRARAREGLADLREAVAGLIAELRAESQAAAVRLATSADDTRVAVDDAAARTQEAAAAAAATVAEAVESVATADRQRATAVITGLKARIDDLLEELRTSTGEDSAAARATLDALRTAAGEDSAAARATLDALRERAESLTAELMEAATAAAGRIEERVKTAEVAGHAEREAMETSTTVARHAIEAAAETVAAAVAEQRGDSAAIVSELRADVRAMLDAAAADVRTAAVTAGEAGADRLAAAADGLAVHVTELHEGGVAHLDEATVTLTDLAGTMAADAERRVGTVADRLTGAAERIEVFAEVERARADAADEALASLRQSLRQDADTILEDLRTRAEGLVTDVAARADEVLGGLAEAERTLRIALANAFADAQRDAMGGLDDVAARLDAAGGRLETEAEARTVTTVATFTDAAAGLHEAINRSDALEDRVAAAIAAAVDAARRTADAELAAVRADLDAAVRQLADTRARIDEVGGEVHGIGEGLRSWLVARDQTAEADRDRVVAGVVQQFAAGLSRRDTRRLAALMPASLSAAPAPPVSEPAASPPAEPPVSDVPARETPAEPQVKRSTSAATPADVADSDHTCERCGFEAKTRAGLSAHRRSH